MYALEREPEYSKRWYVFGISALVTSLLQAAVLMWASGIEHRPVIRERTHISMRVVRKPIESEKKRATVIESTKSETKNQRRIPTPAKKIPNKSVRAPEPMPYARKPSNPQSNVPLVVGLTMSSTVRGGRGPKFGVGNTLMGTVERKARTPQAGSLVYNTQDRDEAGDTSILYSTGSKERTEAKLLTKTVPNYPYRARSEGIEGVIVLALTINPKGRVEAVRLIKGLGHGLDESALTAARKTIWKPATIGGQPVRTVRRYNVRFTLES